MALHHMFYRLYTPRLHSQRMPIPADFLSQYGADVPSKFIFETDSGRAFHVSAETLDEKYYFDRGWPRFVEENALQSHELILFELVEPSKFSIKIFGINSCLKLTPTAEDGTGESADMQLRNPSFTCVITKTNLKRQIITIPADFWTTYLGDSGLDDGARVTLHSEGRKWLASLSIISDRVNIATGNGSFMSDTSFYIGASCTFHLAHIHPLSFTVSMNA